MGAMPIRVEAVSTGSDEILHLDQALRDMSSESDVPGVDASVKDGDFHSLSRIFAAELTHKSSSVRMKL